MCGIFGFITDKPSKANVDLLKDVCVLSSSRGTDSTGIAFVDEEKGKVLIDKAPIPALKYVEEVLPKYEKALAKAHVVIGHTRRWTQGKPEDNHNNHPVVSKRWVMVHNGMCSSMKRIDGYKYNGEVDSEILLSYVERDGITPGLGALVGNASVALINHDKKLDTVYLWRYDNPMYLAYDRTSRTVFFGSTEDILKEGLANELLFFSSYQIIKLPEEVLYKVSHNPMDIEELEEIKAKRTSWYGNQGTYNRGSVHDISRPTSAGITNQIKTWTWDDAMQLLRPNSSLNNDVAIPSTKYYFPKQKQSMDFTNWIRKEPEGFRYYLSADLKLVKLWDKTAATHFIMDAEEAVKDNLIPKEYAA